jgi:hypothetical protein
MKTLLLKLLFLVTVLIMLSGCATEVGVISPGVTITPAPIYVDPAPVVIYPYTYYRPFYYAPRYYHFYAPPMHRGPSYGFHPGHGRGPIHGPGPRR